MGDAGGLDFTLAEGGRADPSGDDASRSALSALRESSRPSLPRARYCLSLGVPAPVRRVLQFDPASLRSGLGKSGDTAAMETFNLFSGVTDAGPDGTDPPGYLCRAARLGPKLGAARLGMSVYDLPPGEAICPYHFEWTDEEWLIAISGRPTLRTPEDERVLDPGDVACFPAGPTGAHHVRNAGEEPVRVAIFSSKNEFGIAEYPDSDKVGIWADGTHYMLRRSSHLEYWDGER